MTSGQKAVVVALAGVLAGVAIFFLVTRVASEGGELVEDDVFEVGDAERFASLIERDNAPLAFPDALERDRPIWVQHLGDDPQEGWLAFDAVVGGCPLQWDPEQEVFVDDCTAEVYPRDGEGLRQYPVTVDEDDVVTVDLKAGRG